MSVCTNNCCVINRRNSCFQPSSCCERQVRFTDWWFHGFLCNIIKWMYSGASVAQCRSCGIVLNHQNSRKSINNWRLRECLHLWFKKKKKILVFQILGADLLLGWYSGLHLIYTSSGDPLNFWVHWVWLLCLHLASFHVALWTSNINSSNKKRKKQTDRECDEQFTSTYSFSLCLCHWNSRSFIFSLQFAFPVLLVASSTVKLLKY